jgi:hypothetical protein
MVAIDWVAASTLILNGFLYFWVTNKKGFARIRGGAISGWISSLWGFYFLLPSGIFLFSLDKAALVLVYSLIAILSMWLVYEGKGNLSIYKIPVMGELCYYLPRVGIFMGGLTAILNQIIV